MRSIAIVQARMASTRLPRKVLADIHGRPMLGWLLSRVRAVPLLDDVVVATTTNPTDDELAQWVREQGFHCFRGSEDDVLGRFAECAQLHSAEIVLRVTADDPLKDPAVMNAALACLLGAPDIDYCSNTLRPTYPEGVDIEAFRSAALQLAHREATLTSEREHVTPYIWKNPERFRLKSLEHNRDLSHWRWTVDKPADLELVRAIFAHFIDDPLVSFEHVASYIEQHPDLLRINSGTARNEGYLKSIESEKINGKS